MSTIRLAKFRRNTAAVFVNLDHLHNIDEIGIHGTKDDSVTADTLSVAQSGRALL